MAAEQGIVLDLVSDQTARVRTFRSSACEGCAAQKSCTEKPEDLDVEAINDAGAKVGDRVLVTFDTSSLLKATFLLYIFPVIWLIAGAVAGQWLAGSMDADSSIVSVVAGLICFAGAVWFVKRKANLMGGKEAYTPRIARILGENSGRSVSRRELPDVCPNSVSERQNS